MESDQLLTQSEVLKNEVLAGPKNTDQPAYKAQQRLVRTGGRLVKHARYYWLLLAEGHLTRRSTFDGKDEDVTGQRQNYSLS
jgi:hypothetical protein